MKCMIKYNQDRLGRTIQKGLLVGFFFLSIGCDDHSPGEQDNIQDLQLSMQEVDSTLLDTQPQDQLILQDASLDFEQDQTDIDTLDISMQETEDQDRIPQGSCGTEAQCPQGYQCQCGSSDHSNPQDCVCRSSMNRGCETDQDCRENEECRSFQRQGSINIIDQVCWLDPSPYLHICPGSEGCRQSENPSNTNDESTLHVGASSFSITPNGFETPLPDGMSGEHMNFNPPISIPSSLWRDCGYDDLCPEDEGYNGPDDGELDGQLQGVFIAGFAHGRPAQKCPPELIGCGEAECCISAWAHDDLKAQIVVIEQGETTVALVALDVVGFFRSDIEIIRRQLQTELDLDLVLIGSTHSHEGPDTLGQFGPGLATAVQSGVDPKYMAFIRRQVIQGIKEAHQNKRPAIVKGKIIDEGMSGLGMSDSRPPYIIDHRIPTLIFEDESTSEIIASILSVGNHAEFLWSRNPYLSADYFHYTRTSLSQGLNAVDVVDLQGNPLTPPSQKPSLDGLGGVVVMFAGAVGGLINPGKGKVIDYSGKAYEARGFKAARAAGQQIASRILRAYHQNEFRDIWSASPVLKFAQVSFLEPVENTNFLLGGFIFKLFKREVYNALHLGGLNFNPPTLSLMSEATVMQLGEVTLFTAPGEVFPELLTGGYPNRTSVGNPTRGDIEEVHVESICDENGLPILQSEDENEQQSFPCLVKPNQENPPPWEQAPFGPYLYEIMGEFPFFIGLTGDFLGYIVPEYDYQPDNAPGQHYEESNSVGQSIASHWIEMLNLGVSALNEAPK